MSNMWLRLIGENIVGFLIADLVFRPLHPVTGWCHGGGKTEPQRRLLGDLGLFSIPTGHQSGPERNQVPIMVWN